MLCGFHRLQSSCKFVSCCIGTGADGWRGIEDSARCAEERVFVRYVFNSVGDRGRLVYS